MTQSVVVTGANGFVGSYICAALLDSDVRVRGLVRRSGTAPDGVEELVGDFADPRTARAVVEGAVALVTTVHPMAEDLATQRRVGVEGTLVIARAAAAAGLARHVHLSTAAVYDRRPGVGDVDETSPLAGGDADPYSVSKQEIDAALAEVGGTTRVLLRPPAVLGTGPSSVWNTLRPAALRDHPASRHGVADQTFPWVHVTDLAGAAADVATGAIEESADPALGPVPGGCTPLNLCGGPATVRDYLGTVADALGVEMTWDDGPAWTGQLRADRAEAWGCSTEVDLEDALEELAAGLRAG